MIEKKKHPEYKILYELLDMASDEFSNHGCNDFYIDNTPENVELLRMAHEWNTNGDTSEPFEIVLSGDGTKIYVMDYYLMDYFSHLFKKLSETEG